MPNDSGEDVKRALSIRGPRPSLPRQAQNNIQSTILELKPDFPPEEFPLLFQGIERLARFLTFGSKPPRHWKVAPDQTRLFVQDEMFDLVLGAWVPAGFRPINPVPPKKRQLSQELTAATRASEILHRLVFSAASLSQKGKNAKIISANKWLLRASEPQIPLNDGSNLEQELLRAFRRTKDAIGILEHEIQRNRRADWYDPTMNRWLDGLTNLWEVAGFQVDQGAAFIKFAVHASGPETKPTEDVISENTVREFIQRRATWHEKYRRTALGEKPVIGRPAKPARLDP